MTASCYIPKNQFSTASIFWLKQEPFFIEYRQLKLLAFTVEVIHTVIRGNIQYRFVVTFIHLRIVIALIQIVLERKLSYVLLVNMHYLDVCI
jgi:hypothetical protein